MAISCQTHCGSKDSGSSDNLPLICIDLFYSRSGDILVPSNHVCLCIDTHSYSHHSDNSAQKFSSSSFSTVLYYNHRDEACGGNPANYGHRHMHLERGSCHCKDTIPF